MNDWTALIATHNRAAPLAETLRRIPEGVEVVVVDNASTDGTAEMVRAERPDAQLVRLDENLGPVAKSIGLERATRTLIASLDDDAAPLPGAWEEMARWFMVDQTLGCAGFGVRLPDGGWECAALPRVFVGAACAFRREALVGAGAWDARYFMQAEEYDLSFRLAMRGWRCEVLHEVPALHRKTHAARLPARTIRLDARNNALLARTRLPEPWDAMYAEDWALRYRLLGKMSGAKRHALAGLAAAEREWSGFEREPMPKPLFDHVFRHAAVREGLRTLYEKGARRLTLARWGKNALAFVEGARLEDMEVVCVADDRFAEAGLRSWRGVPVRTARRALREKVDAIVIADSAPIFATQAAREVRACTGVPVVVIDGADVGALERAHAAYGNGDQSALAAA